MISYCEMLLLRICQNVKMCQKCIKFTKQCVSPWQIFLVHLTFPFVQTHLLQESKNWWVWLYVLPLYSHTVKHNEDIGLGLVNSTSLKFYQQKHLLYIFKVILYSYLILKKMNERITDS